MGSINLSPQHEHRELRLAEQFRETHHDELPSTPFWHYLEHRWQLAPKRFGHWHPLIGRWIAEDYAVRHEVPPTEPQTITPPPPIPSTGAVPEPGSLVMLAVGIVMAWAWRNK